jgi:hypothetical protein
VLFDLNEDSGTGNLNVRAYIASVVGPRRIAHGQRTVKRVSTQQTVSLLGATASGVEVAYFEVWLPQSSITALPGGGAFLAFSSSESAGQDAFQLLLSATQRYSGILLPDDQVYVQAVRDALGAPLAADVSIVVSSVVF